MHFYYHKCLFKCDMRMFNNKIKYVLIKLFSYDNVNYSQSRVFKLYDMFAKCIILLLSLLSGVVMRIIISPFLICNKRCEGYIDKLMFIEFYTNGYFGSKIHLSWCAYNNARTSVVWWTTNRINK